MMGVVASDSTAGGGGTVVPEGSSQAAQQTESEKKNESDQPGKLYMQLIVSTYGPRFIIYMFVVVAWLVCALLMAAFVPI